MSLLKNSHKEAHLRSIVKAVMWRVLATVTTMVIAFFVTGQMKFALSIGAIEAVFKIGLFYLHERLWAFSSFGKRYES